MKIYSDRFFEETLADLGYWQRNNLFFLVNLPKPLWEKMIGLISFRGLSFSKAKVAIFSKNDEGLAIVPLTFKLMNPQALKQKSRFIPNDEITAIEVKKIFTDYRILIYTRGGETIKLIAYQGTDYDRSMKEFIAPYI